MKHRSPANTHLRSSLISQQAPSDNKWVSISNRALQDNLWPSSTISFRNLLRRAIRSNKLMKTELAWHPWQTARSWGKATVAASIIAAKWSHTNITGSIQALTHHRFIHLSRSKSVVQALARAHPNLRQVLKTTFETSSNSMSSSIKMLETIAVVTMKRALGWRKASRTSTKRWSTKLGIVGSHWTCHSRTFRRFRRLAFMLLKVMPASVVWLASLAPSVKARSRGQLSLSSILKLSRKQLIKRVALVTWSYKIRIYSRWQQSALRPWPSLISSLKSYSLWKRHLLGSKALTRSSNRWRNWSRNRVSLRLEGLLTPTQAVQILS